MYGRERVGMACVKVYLHLRSGIDTAADKLM